jgi:hypothetical protein
VSLLALTTEKTDLDNIDNNIGQAITIPAPYTVLDRLKEIAINTSAGSGSSNFTTTNSTNVDLSKTDLDDIRLDQGLIVDNGNAEVITQNLILGSTGLPVVSPLQYTVLDRLKQIQINTSGGGSNVFDGIITNPNILGDYALASIYTPLTIGNLFHGNNLYLDSLNPTHFVAIKQGMYNISAYVNIPILAYNLLGVYVNGVKYSYSCWSNYTGDGNCIQANLFLNINDYVEIIGYSNNAQQVYLQNTTFNFIGIVTP